MAIHRITFGTFNTLNLHEANKRVHRSNNYYSQANYEKKVKWVGGMLDKLEAEVVGFQEVWSKKALKEAIESSNLFSENNIIEPTNNDNDSSVALVTTLKHGTPIWHKHFPAEFDLTSKDGGPSGPKVSVNFSRFSRPVLQVMVKVPIKQNKTREVQVFVAHLKSKLPSELDDASREKLWDIFGNGHTASGRLKLNKLGNKIATGMGSALATVQRTTEAAALRYIIAKEMYQNDRPVVVLGDLNDGARSVSTSIITGDPSYRTVIKTRQGRSNDTELFSAEWMQQYRSLSDVYYTHIYESRRESLDHVLVSEQFYDHSRKRIWTFEELKIFNDHLVDDHVLSEKDKTVSDHAAVTATFRHNPWNT